MYKISFFILTIFFSLSSIAQDFEQQLKNADHNWLDKNLGAAISGYTSLIQSGSLPDEYKPLISQSAWEDIRWKTMLKKEHLRNNYWENKLWQTTFPELKNIFENADKNYYTDNILVNGKTLFFKKADITPVFNNILLQDPHNVLSIDDVKKYITPWHLIPLEEIGNYR